MSILTFTTGTDHTAAYNVDLLITEVMDMEKEITCAKTRCPICGRECEYPEGGYNPPTCSTFACLQKYLHNPEYKEARYQDYLAFTKIFKVES